jgi:hypothetical protein
VKRQPHNSLEQYIDVNGIQVKATIRVYVEEDFDSDPFDMDFESDKDKRAYVRRFKNGELFSAGIIVEASAHGETGSDSLWNVHMHTNNMFNPSPFEADLKETIECHGMIQIAVDDLKRVLTERANELTKFAVKGGAK